MTILRLMTHPDINMDVQELDNGASILLTSANEQLVQRLRDVVHARQDKLRGLAGGPKFDQAAEKLDINVRDVDGGVEITITSDDDRVAKALKKRLLARLQSARHKAAMARLILSDKIEVDLKKIDDGIVLSVTSDDADLVEKIQHQADARMERYHAIRERMQQRQRGRRGGRGRGPQAE
jgi:hypothetical protein